ncbi:MAG: putative lipid II flippase FtsW, partial [Acidimicrobiales bacterium]
MNGLPAGAPADGGSRLGAALRTKAASRGGRTRLPAVSVRLLSLVATLVAVGLVMVLSASSVVSEALYGTPWSVFEHQVVWVVLGLTGLGVGAVVDYRRWRPLAVPLLGLTIAMLVAVLVPGVGVNIGGSSRWIGLGPFSVQPSEIAKLAIALFCADFLDKRTRFTGNLKLTMRPVIVVFCLVAALVMKQPDMGTTLVIGCIVVGLLFAASTPLKAMAWLGAACVAGAFVLGIAQPYRRQRLLSFLHPWANASGSAYQVVQSMAALGSGHVLGVGLGASRAAWFFLPNVYTDFIFSVIGEELGLVGSLAVLVLFAGLVYTAFKIALAAPDRFGFLLGTGISCWLGAQIVINIGAVIGILPVTGVPLPFVSFGGSSLVIEMAATGMLISIARAAHAPVPGGRGRGAPVPAGTPKMPGRAGAS